ncbi:MAG: type VI secretion system tube protein Hcp [Pseudomonadota bacterium]
MAIYLKFDTEIKGDSQTDGHENWITLDSVQLGVGRAISASGASTDRETSNPSFSELTCNKSSDISSCELFAQSIHGKSLGKGTVNFVNTHEGKPQIYLQYIMHEPIVSSFSQSSGGDRPAESFAINFTKLVMLYQQFDGAKKVADMTKGWDLRTGKEFNEGKIGG